MNLASSDVFFSFHGNRREILTAPPAVLEHSQYRSQLPVELRKAGPFYVFFFFPTDRFYGDQTFSVWCYSPDRGYVHVNPDRKLRFVLNHKTLPSRVLSAWRLFKNKGHNLKVTIFNSAIKLDSSHTEFSTTSSTDLDKLVLWVFSSWSEGQSGLVSVCRRPLPSRVR